MDYFGYKTAKFIKRLYKVVEDPSIKEIKWSNNGKSFIIPNKDDFLKKVLPHISKTKEYSAFVRLLNHYGFQKIQGMSSENEEYFHKNFEQNNEQNLIYITRTKQRKLQPQEDLILYRRENQEMKEQLEYLMKNNLNISAEINQLRIRIENQDKTITSLIEVLSKVFNMGIKTQKQMALKGDTSMEKKLSTILEEKEAFDSDSRNKRILSEIELRKCLESAEKKKDNFMMLKDNLNNEKEEENEEETFNFADFF
ncbi:putative heat shock factor [Tubulinosema ratisbonensis]|uniref:Putative heat shock factor n=1 Tax=Tubulinosema ratisbonensis TaxID=291195 RepID=A0A437ANX4_9MICR|nr:putative heat shock factor [Tubulinosema ratisbonensis]